MVINLEDKDAAIVVLGLLLVDELLFRSNYPPEVQDIIQSRAKLLIDRIHSARAAEHEYHPNPDTETET